MAGADEAKGTSVLTDWEDTVDAAIRIHECIYHRLQGLQGAWAGSRPIAATGNGRREARDEMGRSRMPVMKRLLAAMLAASTIAMSILQPAHAENNAPTDTRFCPPWNYYNTAEERCVSPPASH